MRVRRVLGLLLLAAAAPLSAQQPRVHVEKLADGVWAGIPDKGANVGWFAIGDGVTATMVRFGYPGRDVFGVRLALEEALVNALKHGHGYDPTRRARVRYRVTRRQVLARVTDQGPGVPEPFRRRIFEKFFRVEHETGQTDRVRGTGIGCYFDDPMHELLGLTGEGFQSLYHFTAGGPVDDPRLRTRAPYAHLGPPDDRQRPPGCHEEC